MFSLRSRLIGVMMLLWLLQAGASPLLAQPTQPVVALSPGHGWNNGHGAIDPGAVRGDLVEKDINLEVAVHARDLLSRCPLDVFLTREGDDLQHTLEDVDEIVNTHQPAPALGISIHTNSGGPRASGSQGWYTVGGYDDRNSQYLAGLLSAHIAGRLAIPDRGTQPETRNRHGGLYIHYWNTPSALIEIGYLQGDAELLRQRRRDFGRAIAQATLAYLHIPDTCADAAVQQETAIATYVPGSTQTNRIRLLNDGIAAWQPGDYALINVRNRYGARDRYAVPGPIAAGETATWEIEATAPATPGIYAQVWQLRRGDVPVGPEVSAYLIVVPKEAQALRDQLERQIEEWRRQGERDLKRLLEQLQRDLAEWLAREAEKQVGGCLPAPAAVLGLVAGGIIRSKRKRP